MDDGGTVTWKASGAAPDIEDFEASGQTHIDEAIVHAAAKEAKLEEDSYNPFEEGRSQRWK